MIRHTTHEMFLMCQKLSSLECHDHDFSWNIRSRLVHEKISVISDSIA